MRTLLTGRNHTTDRVNQRLRAVQIWSRQRQHLAHRRRRHCQKDHLGCRQIRERDGCYLLALSLLGRVRRADIGDLSNGRRNIGMRDIVITAGVFLRSP